MTSRRPPGSALPTASHQHSAARPGEGCRRLVRRIASALFLAIVACAAGPALAATAAPASVALWYGADPPWDELAAFDWAVVEPDHAPQPVRAPGSRTEFLAYVSVGELAPGRSWASELPAAWRIGANPAWGSIVLDQRPEAWPAFLVERVLRPLWNAGYRGFFLDTLDSWRLVAKTEAEASEQQAGLVRVIRAMRAAFPEAKLVFNRGFELLPELHAEVAAVAVESFFEGWDPATRRYRPVADADRDELLAVVQRVVVARGLPVLAIDYVAPGERARARETAARLRALGFVPWVANVEHSQLGVGAVEVMPRKVLMIHDGGRGPRALADEYVARYAALPLQWLGYVPEYRDVSRDAVPDQPLAGRWAGIVLWLYGDDEANAARLKPLLERARIEGVRVAIFGRFGVPAGAAADALFETTTGPAREDPGPVRVATRTSAIGWEIEPLPARHGFRPLAAKNADVWLRIADTTGATQDAVAITAWGGYALAPYDLLFLPANRGARWVVQPMTFLARALALPTMPVPDVTTEAGRRLLLVRVAGEGFTTPTALAAAAPGKSADRAPLAGEVLLREVIEPRAWPTTFTAPATTGAVKPLPATAKALVDRTLDLPFVEPAAAAPLAEVPGAPTRAERSITLLAPRAVPGVDGLVVNAPGASDDFYTNRGNGPVAGYTRAIETFELTESPLRLAPVDLSYHARAAGRRVSLDALRTVYDWAARQSLHPVFASEYVAKVRDFQRMVVARDAEGAWLVRGAGDLRQLRLPAAAGTPDLAASRGIAGWRTTNDMLHVHTTGQEAFLRVVPQVAAPQPRIESANGRIDAFAGDANGFTATLVAHVPPEVVTAEAGTCEMRADADSKDNRGNDQHRGTDRQRAEDTVRSRRAPATTSYGNGNSHGGSRATLVCRR